jgi:hypothetical protein
MFSEYANEYREWAEHCLALAERAAHDSPNRPDASEKFCCSVADKQLRDQHYRLWPQPRQSGKTTCAPTVRPGNLNQIGNDRFIKVRRRMNMVDKDRIEGTGDKAKGSMKEGVGKLTGDEKLDASKNSGRIGDEQIHCVIS